MKIFLLSLVLFTSFNLAAQVPTYVPTNGLVGWWPFNGNANDESGNGYDGVVNGAVLSTDRFGLIDAAYSFDGIDDNIEVQNYQGTLNALSISLWFNQTISGILLDFGNETLGGSNNFANRFNINDYGSIGNLMFSFDYTYGQIPPTNYSSLGWNHTAVTWDGSTMNLYVNNLLIGTQTSSISEIRIFLSDIKRFGSRYQQLGSNQVNFGGIIDDIGIWNRALDSNEVNDLFFALPCTPNPITDQPTDQTVNMGNDATFSFTDTLSGATYQWQMDAGTGYSDLSNAGQFSGADTDSLIISTTTMGNNNTNYRCIVTESVSCMDTTDVVLLTVINNASIGELNSSLVRLFPNPSNDIITLTLAQHSNGQIILTDILGKEVLSKRFTTNEVQVNLKRLAAKGTYFAKIIDLDGNVIAIKKLIYQ